MSGEFVPRRDIPFAAGSRIQQKHRSPPSNDTTTVIERANDRSGVNGGIFQNPSVKFAAFPN
jgi:hypothetical protein